MKRIVVLMALLIAGCSHTMKCDICGKEVIGPSFLVASDCKGNMVFLHEACVEEE